MLLKLGSKGTQVEALQKRLADLGYYTGKLDGDYGPATQKAVANYQTAEHLKRDGIVGDDVLGALGMLDFGSKQSIIEIVPLRLEDKLKLFEVLSVFEGDFDTLNRDGEYEGWFDRPHKTMTGTKLQPMERRKYVETWNKDQLPEQQLKWEPNGNSKFGARPRHVGLSFGFIQFTQNGGSLGVLLARMQQRHPELFAATFGPCSAELVRVVSKKGSDVMTDDGLRGPDTMPVAGVDIWKSPWTDRFIEAGNVPEFQKIQLELAVEIYFDPMITLIARPFNIRSETGLAILADRCVQYGVSGALHKLAEKHFDPVPPQVSEIQLFKDFYRAVKDLGWSHRVRTLMESPELSFYRIYDLDPEL